MFRGLLTRTRVISSALSHRSASLHPAFSTSKPKIMAVPPNNIFDSVRAEKIDGVLSHTVDRYDGVIISSKGLPTDVESFQIILESSIHFWKGARRRGVWLKVPIEKSVLVAPAVEAGFVFHHAEKEYVMMNHWLSEDENRMPANASHQVGVGCVVVNNGKLLMVQEKNGPLRGTGVWKMPTGLSDPGEDLYEAAVREVLEETGIDTEFVSIINIRQSHTALFGKSDLFFVCLLKPKNTTITMQPAEIAACEWVDAEVYLQQAFFKKSPIFNVVNNQIRQVLNAVATDPNWIIVPDSEREAVATTESVGETAADDAPLLKVGVNPLTSDDLPVPGLVVSKLPNGIRPGESVVYHFPV